MRFQGDTTGFRKITWGTRGYQEVSGTFKEVFMTFQGVPRGSRKSLGASGAF